MTRHGPMRAGFAILVTCARVIVAGCVSTNEYGSCAGGCPSDVSCLDVISSHGEGQMCESLTTGGSACYPRGGTESTPEYGMCATQTDCTSPNDQCTTITTT